MVNSLMNGHKKTTRPGGFLSMEPEGSMPQADQWNCSSSVEPVRAFTEDEPPWITVVTSSK
jgi:hypothetical protein